MTLYYSLVFVLLVVEMFLFCTIIAPMPYKLKRKFFNFLAESPIIAKLQYGMKITFIFILILFLDSVNRVYRVQVEMSAFKGDSNGAGRMAAMGAERSEVQARRFYSQRNMYLCGSTLFLSVILNRTYMLVLDTLRLQDKLMKYEGDPAAMGSESDRLSQEGRADQIGQLKREIGKKDKQIEAMKSQSQGLQKEYESLSLKYNQLNPGSSGDKKSN